LKSEMICASNAVSLMETVRTYTQTVAKLEANPEIAPLVAAVHKRAQDEMFPSEGEPCVQP
jgi:hypothetical protein